jgi:arylsulfatase
MLKKLDDLGQADNTIVVFTTDNGAEVMSWPDGGTTPFRGEKDTNWEGGWRVPTVIRWPGVIKPGTIVNDVLAHEDFLPTFAAAAGEPEIVEKVKQGYLCGDRTFKVHLDGYNFLPFFKGEVKEPPRKEFFYWSDEGQLLAMRYENWKIEFMEQRAKGFAVWSDQFTSLRMPKLFNLRSDPFERGDESILYYKWAADRMFVLVPAQAVVGKLMETFKEFPIRQKPSSFSINDVMEKLEPQAK